MPTLVPYTNEGDTFITIGLTTIPPGQTREVDQTLLPDYQAPTIGEVSAELDPHLPLRELLDGNVDTVLTALPDMPTDEIEILGELEQQGKARKTILGAIAELLLNRAGGQGGEA